MPSQCSALNKTTGRRCKSRPSNPCGTCSRHTPTTPSEEELAAALADLRAAVAAKPLLLCTPVDFTGKTVAEVEAVRLTAATQLHDETRCKSTELWMRCRFLGLENDFTTLYNSLLAHDLAWMDRICSAAEQWEKLAAEERAELEAPASTCWGCRENQPNQLAHTDPGGCLYTDEF